MKKILLTTAVFCCSIAIAQNLNFSDSKFKALLLTSSPSNEIAKDFNGNFIAIDFNQDGEIQVSEAQNIQILNIKMDDAAKYNESGEINYSYYFSKLPNSISDVVLFSNLEELYVSDTKSASIAFINNSKIRKIVCENRWFTKEESFNGNYYETDFYPVDFTLNNCAKIISVDDVNVGFHPDYLGQTILRFINNPQISGDLTLKNSLVTELYFENTNFSTITINDCFGLKKLSIPKMTPLTKLEVTNSNLNFPYDQEIELIANNCTNLEDINVDGDTYDSHSVYFSSINVDGNSKLKRIKGLNSPTINFANAGLVSLEELDCAYYNRYVYTGHQDGFAYWGNVKSVNLQGLPSLKIFKAFNQPIAANIDFSSVQNLENIDLTNSASYMSEVNVSNLAKLTTLKVDRLFSTDSEGLLPISLKNINAENCPNLMNFDFYGNSNLETLNLKNCINITGLAIGSNSDAFKSMPNFQNLNIENAIGLSQLSIENTKMSSLNTLTNSNLESLTLNHLNQFANLDLSKNVKLSSISFGDLQLLVNTDFSKNSQLASADFYNMSIIKSVDLSKNGVLNTVSFWNTPSLEFVNIHNSKIEDQVGFDMVSASLTVCVDDAQLQNLQSDFPNIKFITSCDSTLGAEISTSSKLVVFPNPTSQFVEVRTADKVISIDVFDAQGRLERTYSHPDSNKIDVSSLPAGIYLMKIKMNNEAKVHKLIKK